MRDRHEQFLRIAGIIAENATCTRAHVGAVIVRDRRIIALGYNGSPPHLPHCEEVRQMRFLSPPPHYTEMFPCGDDGCENSIHAEANAITWAARTGIATEGATMYCTHGPCVKCAQLMLSAGIVEAHHITPYRDTRGEFLLSEAKVRSIRHERN